MGWIRNVQCPASHPACHDALRHLLLSHAGVHRHAVPRRPPCRKLSDGGEYTIRIKGEIVMTESQRNLPRVVSRDEWFAARKELLAKEKELTRQRDALNESVAPIEYNYPTRAEHERTGSDAYAEADQPIERPGRSSFLRDGDSVYHTYSVYARGLETLGGSYYFLDETALGRQEDWEEPKGRATDARGAIPDFSS